MKEQTENKQHASVIMLFLVPAVHLVPACTILTE